MPLPQVNERIKEIPAQALRAVFAGIGQVLLVADKIRHRAAEQMSSTMAVTAPPREAPPTTPAPTTPAATTPAATTPAATGPESAPPAKPAAAPRAKPSAAPPAKPSAAAPSRDSARWRSLDKTGNVTLIPESDGAAASAAPADETAADQLPEVTEAPPAPAPAEAPTAPAEAQAPAAPGAAEPAALPLSNYDELSVPSLRARLRVLSASQVSTLLEYEKVTERRPEVIIMFERRLAKLEQENG
jgi:hypothetical protein